MSLQIIADIIFYTFHTFSLLTKIISSQLFQLLISAMLRSIVSKILLCHFYLIKVGFLHQMMSEDLHILLKVVSKVFDISFDFNYHELILHEFISSP